MALSCAIGVLAVVLKTNQHTADRVLPVVEYVPQDCLPLRLGCTYAVAFHGESGCVGVVRWG
jgi:hypothetical protein